MATWLKQSTATTIVVGPFVSTTDGYTAKTGLSITQAKVLVWKQGGTSFGAKNESTTGTHRSNGMYTIPLDTTDTNTLGQFIVSIDDSANAALPVRHDYEVVPANVWDAIFGGTVKLKVDVDRIYGVAQNAQNLAASVSTIVIGTVTETPNAATTTTFESADITTATADFYIGRVIIFTSGALANQATNITDYAKSGSNGVFTFTAMTSKATAGDAFVIV